MANERKQLENKIERGCKIIFGTMALVILILLISVMRSTAQIKVNDIPIPEDTHYIQINIHKPLVGKIKVLVDYGQKVQILKAAVIRGADGKPMKFLSNMDVFNFFIRENWLYVDVFIMNVANVSITTYLFKRK